MKFNAQASDFHRVKASCKRLGLSDNDTLELQAAARRDAFEYLARAPDDPGAATASDGPEGDAASASALWDRVTEKYRMAAETPRPEPGPASDDPGAPAAQRRDLWSESVRRVTSSQS